MKKEYLRIEKLILQADFAKAEKLIKKIDIKDWSGFLSGVAQESGSINPYAFIGYLLQKKRDRNLSFYPDPFGDSDVDGRGYFSIP